MSPRNEVKALRGNAIDAWRNFWFRPTPVFALGAVRMLFGAMVVLWTVSLVGDLDDFFSSYGVVPVQSKSIHEWGLFEIWNGDRALIIGWALLLLSAIALTVGWHSRLAAILVFVLILSFQFRNPYIFNSGDALLRLEALLLALAPSGAALSLDQRRATGKFWSAQMRAPWALRLLQIQLSLIYVSTFQVRMTGSKWPDGTALSYAFRLEDMLIIPLPQWVVTSAPLMNIATWGTLLLELAIGILVWNRRCRFYVLIAGVVLHTTILVTVAVGFFTPAMFVLYLAFVDPDAVRRLPRTLNRLAQQRVSTTAQDDGQSTRPDTVDRGGT